MEGLSGAEVCVILAVTEVPVASSIKHSVQHQEVPVPEFPPVAHVAVMVTDLQRCTRWYAEMFEAAPVLDEDEQIGGFHHTVFALGGGQLFGLHTHKPPTTGSVNIAPG